MVLIEDRFGAMGTSKFAGLSVKAKRAIKSRKISNGDNA